MEEEIVLCAASSYERKFYLNPEFESLPETIRQELQIMCVLYTEDVGGIFMVVYDENGNLELRVDHEEDDFAFDEIGSVLKIKELQQKKAELFESLELFYKVFYLNPNSLSKFASFLPVIISPNALETCFNKDTFDFGEASI